MKSLLCYLIVILPVFGLSQQEILDTISIKQTQLVSELPPLDSAMRVEANSNKEGQLIRWSRFAHYNLGGTMDGWQSTDSTKYIYDGENVVKKIKFINSEIGWIFNRKNIYGYNTSGNKISNMIQKWYRDQWQFVERRRYEYNSDGLEILLVKEKFVEGEWINLIWSKHEYTSDGFIALWHIKKGEGSGWVNKGLNFKKYNSDGLVSHELSQDWVDGKWVNESETMTKYPSSNEKIRMNKSWYPTNLKKRDQRKTFSTFNTDGQLILRVTEIWDDRNGESKYKLTNEVNEESKITATHSQRWDEEQQLWPIGTRRVIEYTSDTPNQNTRIDKKWEETNLVNKTKVTSVNNSKGDLIYLYRQKWDRNTASWIPDSYRYYHYE